MQSRFASQTIFLSRFRISSYRLLFILFTRSYNLAEATEEGVAKDDSQETYKYYFQLCQSSYSGEYAAMNNQCSFDLISQDELRSSGSRLGYRMMWKRLLHKYKVAVPRLECRQ